MGHFYACFIGATLSERWRKNAPADCATIYRYKTVQKRLVLITNLMHNLFILKYIHYDPRHVSSITMLIFRRSNCIFAVSGIVTVWAAIQHTKWVRSQSVYCMAAHREWRYQKLQIYNLNSWIWALYCSKHVEGHNVIYYYRINKLCIKLVINTSPYYDARSENH